MKITGPGDPTDQRLVMNAAIADGTVMKVETGEVEQIHFIDIDARSLASVDERERRAYGFTKLQLAELGMEIARKLGL